MTFSFRLYTQDLRTMTSIHPPIENPFFSSNINFTPLVVTTTFPFHLTNSLAITFNGTHSLESLRGSSALSRHTAADGKVLASGSVTRCELLGETRRRRSRTIWENRRRGAQSTGKCGVRTTETRDLLRLSGGFRDQREFCGKGWGDREEGLICWIFIGSFVLRYILMQRCE